MRSKPLIVATIAAFTFVFITGLIGFYAYKVSGGPLLTPQEFIRFTLSTDSEEIQFPKHANKLNLFYFGYTNCPDVCPLTLTYISQSIKNLEPALQDQIQVYFISVDHQHDNAQTVTKYAKSFDPHIQGLAGTEKQVNELIQQFHGSFTIERAEKTYLGYTVTHTDRVYFTDQSGIVLGSLSHVQSVQEIQNKIKGYL